MSRNLNAAARSRALRRLEFLREKMRRAARERMREAQQQYDVDTAGGLDIGEVCVSDVTEDLDFALIELETETIAKIDEALARLDAGTYGLCVGCGAEITARRLDALPFARECRSCAERREAGGPAAPPRLRFSTRLGPIRGRAA